MFQYVALLPFGKRHINQLLTLWIVPQGSNDDKTEFLEVPISDNDVIHIDKIK
jgi:hypothetical protein